MTSYKWCRPKPNAKTASQKDYPCTRKRAKSETVPIELSGYSKDENRYGQKSIPIFFSKLSATTPFNADFPELDLQELDLTPSISQIRCNSVHNIKESSENEEEKDEESSKEVKIAQSSVFSDEDCGDPLVSQKLLIDFTPNEAIDTAISQRKCNDFWSYIRTTDFYKKFCNLSLPPTATKDNDKRTSTTPETRKIILPPLEAETKMTAYEWFTSSNNDKMNTAMVVNDSCLCDPDDKVLWYNEEKIKRDHSNKPRNPNINHHKKVSQERVYPADILPVKSKGEPNHEVKQMCRLMTEWSQQHPKSMEPPGPVQDIGLYSSQHVFTN